MLKNVVLPAPLGPMIETIECCGIENETSFTATRPPNVLETASVASSAGRSPSPVGAGGAATGTVIARRSLPSAGRRRSSNDALSWLADLERAVARADALGELQRSSSFREQALRPQDHDDEDEEAEDAEVQDREVEVQPDLVRDAVEHLRDEVRVDERQQDRAEDHPPDGAQAAEDDHREQEDREAELELIRLHRGEV